MKRVIGFFSIGFIFLCSICSSPAYAKVVTPEQFGAVVNDGKDDAPALKKALDSLQPGDTLSLRVGVYDVGSTLLRDNDIQIAIVGGATGYVVRFG